MYKNCVLDEIVVNNKKCFFFYQSDMEIQETKEALFMALRNVGVVEDSIKAQQALKDQIKIETPEEIPKEEQKAKDGDKQ